jgi:hypothetical protein
VVCVRYGRVRYMVLHYPALTRDHYGHSSCEIVLRSQCCSLLFVTAITTNTFRDGKLRCSVGKDIWYRISQPRISAGADIRGCDITMVTKLLPTLQKRSALWFSNFKEKIPINNFKNWVFWNVILCQWVKSFEGFYCLLSRHQRSPRRVINSDEKTFLNF